MLSLFALILHTIFKTIDRLSKKYSLNTFPMSDYQRYYLAAAFVAGVVVTLGFKDCYPILQRNLQRRKPRSHSSQQSDGSEEAATPRSGPPAIVDGVEGCIGNTPLLRIKSLSEATGCEILAKAEVCVPKYI